MQEESQDKKPKRTIPSKGIFPITKPNKKPKKT
jgi:hypothetical protein